MTDFLFIPSPSANSGRKRVHLNDFARLFSEGNEELAAPEPHAWKGLRQRFGILVAAGLSQVNSLSPSQARDVKTIRPASQGR